MLFQITKQLMFSVILILLKSTKSLIGKILEHHCQILLENGCDLQIYNDTNY